MRKFIYPALFAALFSVSLNADLLYYTFDGQVFYSTFNEIRSGSEVRYVFGIDLDIQGIFDYLNPSRPDCVRMDSNGVDLSVDFVYVDFVGELLLDDMTTSDTYEYNFGASVDFFNNSRIPDRNFIIGGSQYNSVQAYTSLSPIDTWNVGMIFKGYEEALNSTTNERLNWVFSDLTLTSISPYYSVPVPEPGLSFLATGGIVTFCGACFLRKKSTTMRRFCRKK